MLPANEKKLYSTKFWQNGDRIFIEFACKHGLPKEGGSIINIQNLHPGVDGLQYVDGGISPNTISLTGFLRVQIQTPSFNPEEAQQPPVVIASVDYFIDPARIVYHIYKPSDSAGAPLNSSQSWDDWGTEVTKHTVTHESSWHQGEAGRNWSNLSKPNYSPVENCNTSLAQPVDATFSTLPCRNEPEQNQQWNEWTNCENNTEDTSLANVQEHHRPYLGINSAHHMEITEKAGIRTYHSAKSTIQDAHPIPEVQYNSPPGKGQCLHCCCTFCTPGITFQQKFNPCTVCV